MFLQFLMDYNGFFFRKFYTWDGFVIINTDQ